ncbi:MAG: hypothetical protein IJ342_02055 [Muribaculaceae bacterium]|nr:hypothetical protein [Muribaculaceae bacterium]
MTKEELDAILNKSLREIAIIKTNWIILNGLKEAMQEGAEYEMLLDISPCFWSTTLNNLSSNVLMKTAKIYDEHKDCIGLKKIINICEQNQELFPKKHTVTCTDGDTGEKCSFDMKKDVCKDIRDAQHKYQELYDARMQLMTLRDKYLAHTDKRIFLDVKSFYQEVAFKQETIEILIKTAGDIFNSFLSDLSNTTVPLEFDNADDYEKMLRYAKDGKEAFLQRIKSRANHRLRE